MSNTEGTCVVCKEHADAREGCCGRGVAVEGAILMVEDFEEETNDDDWDHGDVCQW